MGNGNSAAYVFRGTGRVNEPPSDWYVACLLDAAADRLASSLVDRSESAEIAALIVRLRDAAADLRLSDPR